MYDLIDFALIITRVWSEKHLFMSSDGIPIPIASHWTGVSSWGNKQNPCTVFRNLTKSPKINIRLGLGSNNPILAPCHNDAIRRSLTFLLDVHKSSHFLAKKDKYFKNCEIRIWWKRVKFLKKSHKVKEYVIQHYCVPQNLTLGFLKAKMKRI